MLTRLRLLAVWTAMCVMTLAMTAQEPAPAGPGGKWKFRIGEGEKQITMLLMLTEDNGKWVGDFLGSNAKLPQEPKFTSVKVTGEVVQFSITLGGRELVNFDGQFAKDGKKLSGSYTLLGSPLRLTELYPSKLRKLDDAFEVAREDVTQLESGEALFDSGYLVAGAAAEKKLKPEEARAVADKLAKASAAYGPRWERATAIRLAQTFASQEGFADLALAQIRRAERMLGEDEPVSAQIRVLQPLADLLVKTGKPDDAKKYTATIAKLEQRDLAEYTKSIVAFETPAFAGRKAKSDRVVVVELFTGTDSPQFEATASAFEALTRTYTAKDVVLLDYHLHVPSPDALTSPDSISRAGYYAVRVAPAVLVNGKALPKMGGALSAAKGQFTEIRQVIDAELEKAAAAKLTLSVSKDGENWTAKAVADVDNPGEKMTLRFVVVEDTVRYDVGTAVRYHRHLVRAIPGGVKGFQLTKKSQEHGVSVKPGEIRDTIAKYLERYAKDEADFPTADRPLSLRNLKLMALIQDDASNEILQAAQVDLETK